MKYLEQLQSLDEPTKQKVLVVATVVLMVAIIYFWLAYFNGIIVGIASGGQAVAQASPSATAATSTPMVAFGTTPTSAGVSAGPGIFARMGDGLAAMFASAGNLFHDLGGLFQAQRQYIVKPQQ